MRGLLGNMTSNFVAARYVLAPGCQVREEDFGLLFYTQQGPGLFFISSGDLLGEDFFLGQQTLEQVLQQRTVPGPLSQARLAELKTVLDTLRIKGVILEC